MESRDLDGEIAGQQLRKVSAEAVDLTVADGMGVATRKSNGMCAVSWNNNQEGDTGYTWGV